MLRPNVCFSQERPFRSRENQENEGQKTATSGPWKRLYIFYLVCFHALVRFYLLTGPPDPISCEVYGLGKYFAIRGS